MARARNHRSARQAGARFERQIADYLALHVDDRIDRRVKTGAKDRGDITGLRHHGQRLVIECKDYGGQIKAAEWINEAQIAAGNDSAPLGIVAAKRRGTSDSGSQWVLMTVNDLVWFLTGERPDSDL